MADRNGHRSNLVFPVALAVGLPAAIAGQKLAMGDALPMQAVAVMLGAYAMGLVWAALGLTLSAEAGARVLAPWEAMAEPIARERLPALDLVTTVPYFVTPAARGDWRWATGYKSTRVAACPAPCAGPPSWP